VATNPHGNEEHDPQMVANEGGVPQRQSDTRANQPAADSVPAGSEFVVTDENNSHERSNGISWESIGTTSGAQDPHDDSAHSRDYDADFVNDAGNTPSVQADTRANQPTAGNAGNLYHVTDEDVIERDNGATWNQVVDLAHRDSGNPHSDSASTTHAAAHESGGSDEVAHNDLSTTSDDHHAQSHSNDDHTEPLVENAGGAPSIQEDTRANQPVAVEAGRLYYVTDENVIERDTGMAWEQLVDLDHRENTSNPHAVEHSQVNNVSSDQHHAQSHGDADHTRNYDSDFVNDAGNAPSIQADTRSNQPAAGNAGNLYHVTDEDVIERDNGTAWQQVVDLAHRNDTTNPHAVEHSQVNNVSSDQHHAQGHGSDDHDTSVSDNPHGSGDHDSSVADSPHGDGSHSRNYDADFVNVSGDTMNGQLNVDGSDLVLQNNGGLQIKGTNPVAEFFETDQDGSEGYRYALSHAEGELALEVDRTGDGQADSPDPVVVRSNAIDITAGESATDPINLNTDTYVTGSSCMHVGSNITLLADGRAKFAGEVDIAGGTGFGGATIFDTGFISTDDGASIEKDLDVNGESRLDKYVDIGDPDKSGSRGDGERLRLIGPTSDCVHHIQGGYGRVAISWNAVWDNANSTWRSLVANESHSLVGLRTSTPGDYSGFSVHIAGDNANAGDPIYWEDKLLIDNNVNIYNADLQVVGGIVGSVNDGQIQQSSGYSFDVGSGGTGIQMYLFGTNDRNWILRQYDDSNVERGRIRIDNDSSRRLALVKYDSGGNTVADFELRDSGTVLLEFQDEFEVRSPIYADRTNGKGLFSDRGGYRDDDDPTFRLNFDSNNDTNDSGMYRQYSNSSCDVTWDGTLVYVNSEYNHRPHQDGRRNSGNSSYRWGNVWAQDGSINTSDPSEKTDVEQIQRSAAVDRVRGVADSAIQFAWANSTRGRRHAGFDADQLDAAVGDDHAAYVDPSVYANEVHVKEGATGPGNGPKGTRPHELIPDLYAALADALDRIEQLEKA
jgi:hypothetical protein